MNESLKKLTPHRRAGNVVIGGALATILVWVVEVTTAIKVPPEVSVALGTILSFVIVQWT